MTLEQLVARIRSLVGPDAPFSVDVGYSPPTPFMGRPAKRSFDVTIHYDNEYYDGESVEIALARFEAAVNIERVDADAAAARVGEIGGAA